MEKKKVNIPSGERSAFTVIRPRLTVSAYVKNKLRRKRDGCPREDSSDEEFDPKRLKLAQNWFFSEERTRCKVPKEVGDIELSEVSEKFGVKPTDRGRWCLDFTGSSQSSISSYWTALVDKLKCEPVPGCNCVCKDEKKVVWVYCFFEDSLKVHSLLRTIENTPTPMEYSTPQHDVIITR